MLKGSNGENRSADAIGLAVVVGRIANGEVDYVAHGVWTDETQSTIGMG